MYKLMSEIGELSDAFAKQDSENKIEELGDVLVVCIILAELENIDILGALAQAYEKIKDRKGYLTSDGVFVKEE